MSLNEFGLAYFFTTHRQSINQAMKTLYQPADFESSQEGERASQIYWAPILALLFSMLGAFTHALKLVVNVTALSHRLSFSAIQGADSAMASSVINNNVRISIATLAVIIAAVWLTENRITGDMAYQKYHDQLLYVRPVSGWLAAHWTVNVQGFIYPIAKKLRPTILEFDSDPVRPIPLLGSWLAPDVD